MKQIDFIIVGQGLAGSVLAYLLLKRGQKVVVIDNYTEGGKKSSSQIAAGVINPITGMRFVKTWRIDAFLPAARSLYLEIEKVLGVKLWHERLIFRVLRNIEEENNWLLRNTFPDYQPYCGQTDSVVTDDVESKFKPFYALSEVKNGAQVNLPALDEHFRLFFESNQTWGWRRRQIASREEGRESIPSCESCWPWCRACCPHTRVCNRG